MRVQILFILLICVFLFTMNKVFGQGFAPNSGFSNGNPPPVQYSGINWESVRMLGASNGANNSAGTNWQAFGV